jgi:hypothetical protein
MNRLNPLEIKTGKIPGFSSLGGTIGLENLKKSPREEIFPNNDLMTLIEETIRKELRVSTSRIEMEARDCFVELDLPDCEDEENLSDEVLEEWMTDVCNSVFSAAFNFFSKDNMSL